MIAICSFLFDIRALCGFARHTVSHVDEYGNLSSPVEKAVTCNVFCLACCSMGEKDFQQVFTGSRTDLYVTVE